MSEVKRLVTLLGIDMRLVLRDSLLRWMVVLPLAIFAVMAWGLPLLSRLVMETYQVDLSVYNPLIAVLVLGILPGSYGFLLGFLLLDERDQHTREALLITPLHPATFLLARMGYTVLLSTLVGALLVRALGLLSLSWTPLLACSFSAALLGPLMALALAALAGDKVQGFALYKALSGAQMPLMLAYFIDPPLQLAFGVLPNFWSAKMLWTLEAAAQGQPVAGAAVPSTAVVPTGWIYFAISLLVQAALIVWLARRWARRP
ncbi:MAG TPA: hypothetical protein VLV83_17230 [Acidobacteriota bacterium]|nr:hypothetical protein [Acidobacteriota bacterium]